MDAGVADRDDCVRVGHRLRDGDEPRLDLLGGLSWRPSHSARAASISSCVAVSRTKYCGFACTNAFTGEKPRPLDADAAGNRGGRVRLDADAHLAISAARRSGDPTSTSRASMPIATFRRGRAHAVSRARKSCASAPPEPLEAADDRQAGALEDVDVIDAETERRRDNGVTGFVHG